MIEPEQKLAVVADAFAALIAADPWLSNPALPVPVLTERKGDIETDLEQSLNNLGLAVAVVMPDAEDVVTTGSTLSLRVRLVAQVCESVLGNQSACEVAKIPYRPALAAVVRIMLAVHQKPNGLGPVRDRVPGLHEFALPKVKPFQLVPGDALVTYHVTAHTTIRL
ncbi:hypothetical protein [Geminisphaera colitermitum]|uniref:hypothetical protein n=1 Tax=Geminisphaera colitermitum TaxID=1148786 RepID=UPI000158C4F5|nr:hypothetical protein [Geminisphaera colitermitum]